MLEFQNNKQKMNKIRKRIQNEKEIEECNKINSMNKQQKLLEEREFDLKILQYNMEKQKMKI